MIVFNGFHLIGLAFYIVLLVIMIISYVINISVSAKKRKQNKEVNKND